MDLIIGLLVAITFGHFLNKISEKIIKENSNE